MGFNGHQLVVPVVPRPEGFDPRAKPVRWCPIHLRHVHVVEACPAFCGRMFVDECKYADRDPKPEEMGVAMPLVVIEDDVAEVNRWRRDHSPLLKGGSRKP